MNLDTNCLEINKETAELVGIILGDGSIGIYPERWQHQLDISLNNIDEPNYVIYVKHLMESIFNEKVNLSNISGKGVSLRYYKKDIIESLLKLGLVAGNKTKHQVSVPVNILNNQNFAKLCLKGLFDTDGSVSIDSATDLRLMFSSCSKPLALNFYNICNSLGIDPSPSIIYNSKRRSWRIMIAKKDSINKFLTLIKPEKLKEPYRRIWLGCKILHLNSEYATLDILKRILYF
ncbi:MAG: LAGLIDADG family homing endonuclease [Candidatus Lokiarchaeota archaeon]